MMLLHTDQFETARVLMIRELAFECSATLTFEGQITPSPSADASSCFEIDKYRIGDGVRQS